MTETRTTPRGERRGTLRVLEPPRLRLGISTGALYPIPTEDAPDIAARAGLFDLEIMLQTPGEYSTGFMRDLASRSRAAGSRVHAVHLRQQLHSLLSPYARRAREGRTLFSRAIEGTVDLGGKVIVWHGPTRSEMQALDDPARFIDTIADRGAACAAAGLKLAIENVSWCAIASVRDVIHLASNLREFDPRAERIGFAFDPFQADEAGANPFMILSAMEGRVFDVHLSDRLEDEGAERHLPPGEGALPWPALLRAIAGVYSGPLMMEGAIGEDLARLDSTRRFLDPLLRDVLEEQRSPCDGTPPPGILEGIRLFNAGEYYECHEAIEHEWHADTRPIRRLYQGILQIGVGFLHAKRGNYNGALLLLNDGIEKVSDFTPNCLGIDTAALAWESRAALENLRELGPEQLGNFDFGMAPHVRFVSRSRLAAASAETP